MFISKKGRCRGQSRRSGGGGDGGDEEGDGSVGGIEMDGPKEEDENGKRVKKVSFFRFRKRRGRFLRRKACAGGGGGGGGSGGCLKLPRTSDSAGESPTSDPNSPDFSSEMLRILIEKNDFYSKESNPHLDAKTVPSCPHHNIDI